MDKNKSDRIEGFVNEVNRVVCENDSLTVGDLLDGLSIMVVTLILSSSTPGKEKECLKDYCDALLNQPNLDKMIAEARRDLEGTEG